VWDSFELDLMDYFEPTGHFHHKFFNNLKPIKIESISRQASKKLSNSHQKSEISQIDHPLSTSKYLDSI
jgi:hypothetical protein